MSDINKDLKSDQRDLQRSKSRTSANHCEGEVKRTLLRSTSQNSVKEGTSNECQRSSNGYKGKVSSDSPRRRRPNSKQRKKELSKQRETSSEGADGLDRVFAQMALGARSAENKPSPKVFRQRAMADRRQQRIARRDQSLHQRRIGSAVHNIPEPSVPNAIKVIVGRLSKLNCRKQYDMDRLTEDFNKLRISDGRTQQQTANSLSRKRTQSPVFYNDGPSDPKRSRL